MSQNYQLLQIIIAKNWALASAWYKTLCDWRISEVIVVKRANDDLL